MVVTINDSGSSSLVLPIADWYSQSRVINNSKCQPNAKLLLFTGDHPLLRIGVDYFAFPGFLLPNWTFHIEHCALVVLFKFQMENFAHPECHRFRRIIMFLHIYVYIYMIPPGALMVLPTFYTSCVFQELHDDAIFSFIRRDHRTYLRSPTMLTCPFVWFTFTFTFTSSGFIHSTFFFSFFKNPYISTANVSKLFVCRLYLFFAGFYLKSLCK